MSLKQRLSPFLVLVEARYFPLLGLALPQAYVVATWWYESNRGRPLADWFALVAGAAFEFTYVGAIAWAEGQGGDSGTVKHLNRWVWGTALAALFFSVSVALYLYWPAESWGAFLHAGFPLVAFGYTMVVHTVSKPLPAKQQEVPATEVPQEAIEYAEAAGRLANLVTTGMAQLEHDRQLIENEPADFNHRLEQFLADIQPQAQTIDDAERKQDEIDARFVELAAKAGKKLEEWLGVPVQAGSKGELYILKEAYKAGELTDDEAIAQGVKPNTLASWRSRYRKVKVIE